jgi:tetratricopeptide (TPR) repeat protein
MVLAFGGAALADDWADCEQVANFELAIRACTIIIAAGQESRGNLGVAYYNRGHAYYKDDGYDLAIADYDKAIELKPDDAISYYGRGLAYALKGGYDLAIADYDKAIELKPDDAVAYDGRGNAFYNKRDYDSAIADYNKAIQLNPAFAVAYDNRGLAYYDEGDYDRAIADYDKAVELKPDDAVAYFGRGNAFYNKRDYDSAIADYNKAVELKPADADAYYNRGNAHFEKGDPAEALTDFRVAAHLYPERNGWHGKALARIDALEKQLAAANPPAAAPAVTPAPPAVVSLGSRAALVIGNSAYSAVGKLANPQRDAEAIASVLKDDGFDVTVANDVTRTEFIAVLNRFSDAAANADWAMIYFAGHGLQLDGKNYLVPIDAKLLADRDVQDEAVPLDRVITAVDRVRKFGLIVVDACRNNPFLTDMRFTVASRAAQTRGLARVQPQGTILVQFAAQDGQLALDGDDPTGNSPFAAALAKRLATPGLEVSKLLRLVREDVLATTARQQEPTFSGNIPAEDLFFRPPAN